MFSEPASNRIPAPIATSTEPFVAALTITFNITSDDKEHQDAVAVQVIDTGNLTVYDQEIVPATGENGNGEDQNAYYWSKDGPGKHPHTFTLGFSDIVPVSRFNGATITIRSYTYGGHSDFESWIADVNVQAIGSMGTKPVLLDSVDTLNINRRNNGSPGLYKYKMTLG